MPEHVSYTGVFLELSRLTRKGITGYGEMQAHIAVSDGIRGWDDDELEGTLIAGAWLFIAAGYAPVYPARMESGADPELAAAYATMIASADESLDSLITAMGGTGTPARLTSPDERARENGRRWAQAIRDADRKDTLAALVAAAARRSALAVLEHECRLSMDGRPRGAGPRQARGQESDPGGPGIGG